MIHPPSTTRLTPFTLRFSSRKTDASVTSPVVTSRPVGVRSSVAWRTASRPAHCGLSPTMPGWIALTRTGASSIASVRTIAVTAPFTAVTADELERHQPDRLLDVVLADGIRVPRDRREHEPVDRADVGKARCDLRRLRQ